MALSPEGIIQLFLRPAIRELRPDPIPGGPFGGHVIFTRPRPGVSTDAFGFQWVVVAAAEGYGKTDGAAATYYDRPIIDIAVRHRLQTGTTTVTQQESFKVDNGYLLFNESFPEDVQVLIAPGILVTCAFLVRILQ